MPPPCCVVPGCSNRKSGHRFPLSDKEKRAKWLAAIRRDKFYPTVNSRVCRNHFTEEDYKAPKESVTEKPLLRLKADAVPSVFFWTSPLSASAAERKKRVSRKVLQDTNKQPSEGLPVEMMEVNEIEKTYTAPEENRSTCVETGDVAMEIIFEEEVETRDVMDHGTNPSVEEEEHNGDSTQGLVPSSCSSSFMDIKNFSDVTNAKKNYELHFYTGFKDYNHFMMVFNTLGHNVNGLKYHSSSGSASGTRVLTPANEFFLTMVKLRHDMVNKELAIRFDISETSVGRIFITWINFMYCQWREIDLWTPLQVTNENLQVKGQSTKHTIIIDCTEVKIQKPKNPLAQQQMYSSYKSCHTVETLVAITPAGAVVFVSDSYGGAISDRALFEKCGIMNNLKPGDVVLSDRGFQIQDLLGSRDVDVVIPDFVKKGAGQLEPQQLLRSKRISSERIHVERVIGRGKNFNILSGTIPSNLVPLSGRIIFVCYMLVNFLETIM